MVQSIFDRVIQGLLSIGETGGRAALPVALPPEASRPPIPSGWRAARPPAIAGRTLSGGERGWSRPPGRSRLLRNRRRGWKRYRLARSSFARVSTRIAL